MRINTLFVAAATMTQMVTTPAHSALGGTPSWLAHQTGQRTRRGLHASATSFVYTANGTTLRSSTAVRECVSRAGAAIQSCAWPLDDPSQHAAWHLVPGIPARLDGG